VSITHRRSRTEYTIDVRVFDDGGGVQVHRAGHGDARAGSGVACRLPSGTTVWSHGPRDHYEPLYETRKVDEMPDGDWAAPPVTFHLPGNAGYVATTESDLRGYAGMVLQTDGRRGYHELLAHAVPVGYPFTLRFGEAEAARLAKPAAIEGTIATPWRVALVAPPDPKLFPQAVLTPWLKRGGAVWRYLDGGENTPAGIKGSHASQASWDSSTRWWRDSGRGGPRPICRT
jgi:alpha-glucosidase